MVFLFSPVEWKDQQNLTRASSLSSRAFSAAAEFQLGSARGSDKKARLVDTSLMSTVVIHHFNFHKLLCFCQHLTLTYPNSPSQPNISIPLQHNFKFQNSSHLQEWQTQKTAFRGCINVWVHPPKKCNYQSIHSATFGNQTHTLLHYTRVRSGFQGMKPILSTFWTSFRDNFEYPKAHDPPQSFADQSWLNFEKTSPQANCTRFEYFETKAPHFFQAQAEKNCQKSRFSPKKGEFAFQFIYQSKYSATFGNQTHRLLHYTCVRSGFHGLKPILSTFWTSFRNNFEYPKAQNLQQSFAYQSWLNFEKTSPQANCTRFECFETKAPHFFQAGWKKVVKTQGHLSIYLPIISRHFTRRRKLWKLSGGVVNRKNQPTFICGFLLLRTL